MIERIEKEGEDERQDDGDQERLEDQIGDIGGHECDDDEAIPEHHLPIHGREQKALFKYVV